MKEKNKELKAALLAEYHDQDGLSPYEITGIEENKPSIFGRLFFFVVVAAAYAVVTMIEFIRGK